jgi:hypothetical protein
MSSLTILELAVHPGRQQGRRFPSLRLEQPKSNILARWRCPFAEKDFAERCSKLSGWRDSTARSALMWIVK